MKRIASLLCAFVCVYASAQIKEESEWDVTPMSLNFIASGDSGEEPAYQYGLEFPYTNMSGSGSEITLYNQRAETAHGNYFTIVKSYMPVGVKNDVNRTGRVKILSLSIDDINDNPYEYEYYTYTKNGTRKSTRRLMWGFEVNLKLKSGQICSYKIYFENMAYGDLWGWHKYQAYHVIKPRDSGWNDSYSRPSQLNIRLNNDPNSSCDIYSEYRSLFTYTFYNVEEILSISFYYSPGTRLKLSNYHILTQSDYALIKPLIDEGDRKFRQKDYFDATESYSQVIDKGYKKPYIYVKRADAYFHAKFFHSAIDDYTYALSLELDSKSRELKNSSHLYGNNV